MNNVILMGRLTKDPMVSYKEGENPLTIARYTLAVDRPVRNNGETTADFISCVSFGKQGEFASNYLKKGMKICVSGRIQTGSYEKDGQRIYTTDVVTDRQEFCESKNANVSNENANTVSQAPQEPDQYASGVDEELPWLQ